MALPKWGGEFKTAQRMRLESKQHPQRTLWHPCKANRNLYWPNLRQPPSGSKATSWNERIMCFLPDKIKMNQDMSRYKTVSMGCAAAMRGLQWLARSPGLGFSYCVSMMATYSSAALSASARRLPSSAPSALNLRMQWFQKGYCTGHSTPVDWVCGSNIIFLGFYPKRIM